MQRTNTPNIFSYQDYRVFLQEWFAHAKRTRRAMSYRWFAKSAGFHTSNFLLLVMQGKRNLTEESVKKCATALGFNKQEEDFFRNLVFFNQAKTNDEKHAYLRRMVGSQKFRSLKPIEQQQYEYYAAWYHPVVRELATAKDGDGSAEWIAAQLSPTVTSTQVQRSLQLLEELHFLKKNARGTWTQTSQILTTGPELDAVVIHNYHKLLLELTKSVMETMPIAEREMSALTLGIRRHQLPLVRAKIRAFRQDILQLAAEATDPEEVLLLNLQCFPVTKSAVVGKPH